MDEKLHERNFLLEFLRVAVYTFIEGFHSSFVSATNDGRKIIWSRNKLEMVFV